MDKIKIVKSNIGLCVYLDDDLFINEACKFKNIIQILNLFNPNELFIKSKHVVYKDDHFIEEMEKVILCNIKTLYKKRNYSQIEVDFSGNQLEKAIEFSIDNDMVLDADGYDNEEKLCIQLLLNDGDGTCIHFNIKKYDSFKIQESIKHILNNS